MLSEIQAASYMETRMTMAIEFRLMRSWDSHKRTSVELKRENMCQMFERRNMVYAKKLIFEKVWRLKRKKNVWGIAHSLV